MGTDPGLDRVQRWLQACILTQGPPEEAVLSAGEQAGIAPEVARGLVLPSKTLSVLERLEIQRGMFLPRMEEALAIDYPALKHFLGAEAFMRLVARYVETYPSKSYTLNRLGDHLPEFLRTEKSLAKNEFCVDLATLEYALTMVFDGRETVPLSEQAVRAVPADTWEGARLRPIEAFRLLAFDYPVSQYIGAIAEENAFPRIARKKTWVVAYRRNYQVHRMDLKEPAYELLTALASGRTLGEAIETLLARRSRTAVKQSHLFDWFRGWMAEGLFQAVETGATGESC